jgi:phage-related holin
MNNENNLLIYISSVTFGAVSVYLGIDPIALTILATALIFDFLTGMLKAFTLGTYKSKIGIVKTLSKILGIGLVGLVNIMFKYVGMEHDYFIITSMMILAAHDVISSLGNIYVVRTGKELPEMDVMSIVIKSAHQKLTQFVKKILNIKDDENNQV